MRKPTRVSESSETTIDLICVNNGHRVVQWEVINTPISDHSIVLCVLKSGVPKLPACTHETRKNESLLTFESKTDAQFSLLSVSENFVMTELRKLKTNKAIGLDKISAKLLKDASEVIAPIIQKLINMSITQCCFPNLWKSAKVTALFKSGDATNCDNYRPISILPTVSKILERTVKSQLYSYLEENSLLYTQQSGFRSKTSTSTVFLQLTDTLLHNMDKRQVTGVVYLDLKKAFDTVNQSSVPTGWILSASSGFDLISLILFYYWRSLPLNDRLLLVSHRALCWDRYFSLCI